MKTVVIGLSGGVDSAVCAALLQKSGYRVVGVNLDAGFSPNAAKDAQAVADSQGFELIIVNTAARMQELVIDPFYAAYSCGQTPNPCISCNPTVKFPSLFDIADKYDGLVATGHYAVIEKVGLYKGVKGRDQSYMMYRLRREWLARLMFPLGRMQKTEVRRLAAEMGIPVANKPDSMDICFPVAQQPLTWDIYHENGKYLGKGEGVYTIGQRRGLGIASDGRIYVTKIDAAKGEITLGNIENVQNTTLNIQNVHWLIDTPTKPLECHCKIRHTGTETPALVHIEGDTAQIEFKAPVFAGAPGQSAVFYQTNQVLGGGIIV